jgi:indole-3-glycerol phosphate synthase/phosphoribosylanthranilate isomerase
MNILERILETKRREVARMPALVEGIEPAAVELPPQQPRAGFAAAIRRSRPAFVAEVKPRSPSAGPLMAIERLAGLVEAYDRLAAAISVLCDQTYFGGGYDLLAKVAAMTGRPLLAKDFIIDARQVARAASHGASAVLLIAAILDQSSLTALIRAATGRGCDVLLEVHDAADIAKAANAVAALGAATERQRVVLGINNRDLDSLDVDLGRTETLAPLVREKLGRDCLLLAESGIDSPDACRRLMPCVDGFLIGTSLLRSPDPAEFLSCLVSSCNRA